MSDIDYSQQRSLNVGIAVDTGSVGAAAIYDDLVYAQKVFGSGYFYRSYSQMMKRFPMWSERTIRNHIKRLEDKGWVSTKVMKVDGRPVCHYQICRFLSAKFADSMEIAKFAETYKDKETKKETKRLSASELKQLLTSIISLVNPNERATDERGRALRARLKDYTAEEIRNAAVALSKSEWHKENKQMSIDNLLAPSKFGRWYAAAKEAGPRSLADIAKEQDERVRRRAAN